MNLFQILEVIPFDPGGYLDMKLGSESKIREIQVKALPENEKFSTAQIVKNGRKKKKELYLSA